MKFFRILCMFGLALVMNGNWLLAAGPANISGTWTLDLNAPDATSIETLLEAHGVTLGTTQRHGHHGHDPGYHPD